MSLSALPFSPRVREWFEAAFAEPTPAQAGAWPAIATGEHVLISAPTGSGKTLAAFLWALDRLTDHQPDKVPPADSLTHGRRTRVVYVSPLKALSYDIERNLRAPLKGISRAPHSADIRVAIRTGDTPQRERQRMLKDPPDILITTPESLYLMLTSRAREILQGAEWVIVDEIHAVAATKRGAHLALTLERLDALVREAGGPEPQRIGLSATQTPLEEVARFLVGPKRKCRIVDASRNGDAGRNGDASRRRVSPGFGQGRASPGFGAPKPLDVKVHVPVESMVDLQGPVNADSDPLAPETQTLRGSIWPAIYPELLRLIRAHHSTIVFVNNRRSAERLALRLNELAAAEDERLMGGEEGEKDKDRAARGGPRGVRVEMPGPVAGEPGPSSSVRPGHVALREIARAHHGSLAREERMVVEELLKAGEIPCIVATSSLELGIDMGAVDLVVQVESPKSVAAGLQRIGRAGHGVGEVSRGRIFPKFRADLLECAVLVRRMREGAIEPTVVPRNPLDVLAQQIVAMAAAEEELAVEELYERVKRTYSYAELPRRQLEGVLDMLDGRYPSSEFGELRPRIVWDRVGGTIRPRRGARGLAVANAGTIPDRGLYLVTLPDGRRVGELDEEMVYEARPGQVFLLGASSWRIEEIGRDRVIVTPAPGVPGAVPFWKGDGVGRPKELGEAIGAFARWAVEQPAGVLERDYDLDPRAARNLVEYLREQQEATRVLPSDRTVVVERFRDEIGDWRMCVLSPYGGRVHAAWGLALSARIRERLGLEADAISSDDGLVVHLPETDELGGQEALELVMIEPDELEDLVVAELSGSALFGARFREAAGRALLIPRAYPGRRTPLWQQRLKAQTLLEVARRYGDFPIVLETYRECLRDVLDLPGLTELLGKLHRRELSVVEVETASASPFASSLLFDYVATYMYEGDAPNAERRAAALSLDRDLLRELLGQEELRELIDRDALRQLEEELQRRSERMQATSRDELHDALRLLGDLSVAEAAERVLEGLDAGTLLTTLESERRAVRVRIGGEERYIDAADTGLYRDALGTVPPSGLPDAFQEDVPDALERLLRRYAAARGPFTTEQPRARYGLGAAVVESALRELERTGALVRGELHPDPSSLRRAVRSGEEHFSVPSHPAPPPMSAASSTLGDSSSSASSSASRDDGREWCDVEVLRRLRRASLAALRREIEPAERRAFAAFLPAWQGIDRHAAAGAGVERLREQLVPLQGLALTPRTWEREVLPRRVGAYSTTWMDELCASGELVWLGAGALGRTDGRVVLYFREDVGLLGPPPRRGEPPPESDAHARVRARLKEAPCFYADLLADVELPAPELGEALWDLVWSGEVTSDAFAPLRAPRLTIASGSGAGTAGVRKYSTGPSRLGPVIGGPPTRSGESGPAPSPRRGGRFSGRRTAGRASPNPQGRWSLTASLFSGGADGRSSDRLRALAELLLERYGILTRELVLAEGVPGGFAALYPELCRLETLGVARRGYFVEGLGGAQFALPGAVERLRAQRVGEWGGRAGWVGSSHQKASTLVLAATDPAQPYGAALPWPSQGHSPANRKQRLLAESAPVAGRSAVARVRPSPARVPGASVVLVGAEPVLYLERGGRALRVLVDPALRAVGPRSGADPEDQRVVQALAALADDARAGRLPGRIALERVEGEPVLGSRWEATLERAGFRVGPRRVELGTR